MLPASDPTLGQVSSLSIECGDCGHSRWRKPQELYGRGVGPMTSVAQLGMRLQCSSCREEGLPGKTISIQVMFVCDSDRVRVEAARLNSREARAAG